MIGAMTNYERMDTGSLLQTVFAKSSFGPILSRPYSVVLVSDSGHLTWFAETLLFFIVKWDGYTENEEELAAVKRFKVAPPVDEKK